MVRFIVNNKYIIGLMVIVLLCLWQLSFFHYISKWDNIDAYLSYRYFVSDCFWNGHFPFWNPSQLLGVPVYSDLQSGTWYPITWIIMLFGKYTITSLTVEILSCYIIAAYGFYKLSISLYKNQQVSFLLALCYSLSGFMIGTSQILPFLIGISWLPWIIYAILRFFDCLNYKYIILTALFFALSTSGASPPFTIILIYILIVIFIYNLWKNKAKQKEAFKIIKGMLMLIGLSFLLLLPYINSFYEFLPYFNRLDKLPFEKLTYNNFLYPEYVSFLYPYTVLSNFDVFKHTDVTLRDGYFGVIGFVFLCVSLISVRNKYFFPLIIGAVLSLVFAAGASLPFYKIIYYLPGIGVFKHTSFFKCYFIFSCLLLAGFSLKKEVLKNSITKTTQAIIIIISSLTLIVSFIGFYNTSSTELINIIKQIFSGEENFTFSFFGHLFINGLIILFLLIIWLFLKRTSVYILGLTIIVVLDVFTHSQLSAPETIFNNIKLDSTTNYFNNLPANFNQKAAKIPLKNLGERQGLKSTEGFWRNLSTYNKTLSYVGYNPMRFKSYELAEENGGLKKTIENPLLFFQKPERTAINSTFIGYNEFKSDITNNSNQTQKFLLNQNYHTLWKAYYNEKPLTVTKENGLIMGVEIPAKSYGEIQFVFESPKTIYAVVISILTYLTVILYLFNFQFAYIFRTFSYGKKGINANKKRVLKN